MFINAILSLITSAIVLNIIDNVIIKKDNSLLIKAIAIYFLFSIFQHGFEVILSYTCEKMGNNILIDIKKEIIESLFYKNGEYYSSKKIGEIISIINIDTIVLSELITENIYKTISNIIVSIAMISYLAYLQWDLLLIIIIIQPIMLFIQKYLASKTFKAADELRQLNGESMASVQEFVSNAIQFISLGLKNYYLKRYIKILRKTYKKTMKLQIISTSTMACIDLISCITFSVVIGFGGYKVTQGLITIGVLITFIQYSQKLLEPFYQLIKLNIEINRAKPSVDRVLNLINKKHDSNSKLIDQLNNTIKTSIEFKDVSYAYENENYIFKDVNIKFKKDKIYAIIGKSGVGKSTLCNLLLGIWNVKEGDIYINNCNIKEYDLEFIRKNITLISQECFILNDSIYNNIILDYESIDKKTVDIAIKEAGLYDDIKKMPNGVDTLVGDNGFNISGGQRQRIGIARAIIRNTEIVIFDEPTSALDQYTEKIVINNIKSIFKDKIVIIISHSDRVIKNCDIVYLVKDGEIKQSFSCIN